MDELPWSAHGGLPWLTLLQLLPLTGALLVWRWRQHAAALWLGRTVALSEFCLALLLWRFWQDLPGVPLLQFAERYDPLFYHAAADGITVLFVLLAALIVLLLSFYQLNRERLSPGTLLALLLLAEASLMVMLSTLNLLWFCLASALEIGLVALLLRRWAIAPEADQALARFLQYQGLGWLLWVAGCVVLAWGHADALGGLWSFDVSELLLTPPQGRFQSVAFFLLFYGLAVRTPLFPLHGWLPNFCEHGMIAIAPILLLGVKVGIYGMLRFILPLTPQAVLDWQIHVVVFAGCGVFFAAALALLQHNLRRLLAFAVVSHTSLIVIGLFTLQARGIQGSMLLAVNFGLAVTVMLLMVAYVVRRTGTAELNELAKLGGLFERIPFIAIAFFVGGLAIVGMPGTPGFDAAHLVLEAAIERFGALPTVATALGNVAAAGFLLWAFQRAFLAPVAPPTACTTSAPAQPASLPPPVAEGTQWLERLVGGLAVAVLLLAGFLVEPWLALTELPAQAIALRFGGTP